MAIFARSPQTRIFWKSGKGGQGEIFQKWPQKSPRLKGKKGFWWKWHHPLISMHLKTKDWERFWCKKRLKECPNCQVMAIFAWSPKTRIFWKSLKAGTREIFQNPPEYSPRFKGPKALWRKWYYPLISMRLNWKDWKAFWRKQRLQKCPNGEVIAIFGRSPKTSIFRKSEKGRLREVFGKSPKK